MRRSSWVTGLSCASILAFSGLLIGSQDQDLVTGDSARLTVAHGECTYFGPQRDKFVHAALKAVGRSENYHPLSDMTTRFTAAVNNVPAGGPTYTFNQSHQAG